MLHLFIHLLFHYTVKSGRVGRWEGGHEGGGKGREGNINYEEFHVTTVHKISHLFSCWTSSQSHNLIHSIALFDLLNKAPKLMIFISFPFM